VFCLVLFCFPLKYPPHGTAGGMERLPQAKQQFLVLQRAAGFPVSVSCLGQAEVVGDWSRWLQTAGGCRGGLGWAGASAVCG
jgi:hypothetical protein